MGSKKVARPQKCPKNRDCITATSPWQRHISESVGPPSVPSQETFMNAMASIQRAEDKMTQLSDQQQEGVINEPDDSVLSRKAVCTAGQIDPRSVIQRKIGVEIEVSGSNFSATKNEDEKIAMAQGQTMATIAGGGKTLALKAEGPEEGNALAEFVSPPYGFDGSDQFLAAIGVLAAQAGSISQESGAPDWTPHGDAENIVINDWPDSPEGGFQFTISPIENTVPQLFNAFPANKISKYSRDQGFYQEDHEKSAVTEAIQKLRVGTAVRTGQLFWQNFESPETGMPIPGELHNVIIALAETLTWRFGLLVTDMGSTVKNALTLMPKFDLEKLLRQQLASVLGEEKLYLYIGTIKTALYRAFEVALMEQIKILDKEVSKDIDNEIECLEIDIQFEQEAADQVMQYEQQNEEERDMGYGFSLMLARKLPGHKRIMKELQTLKKDPFGSTLNDIYDVIFGRKKLLGDIQEDDPDSILEDEGSLVTTDGNAPEGAYEHRNPFNAKVSSADWVDASRQYLRFLNDKGIWI